MFGSWFSKPPRKGADSDEQDDLAPAPSSQPLWPPGRQPSGPSQFRTPHDDVLERLDAEHPELGLLNKARASTAELPLPAPTATKEAATRAGTQPDAGGAPPPAPDRLFDPFSGHAVGAFAPGPLGDPSRHDSYFPSGAGAGAPAPAPTFDGTRTALWEHLARVRALQAHVADAHVALEGAALGERPGGGGARRMSSTVGVPGARRRGSASLGLDVDDDDAERRREREDEFGRLPGRFAGRAEAVEDIMQKLDELGKTLTAFHALPTPAPAFPAAPAGPGMDDSVFGAPAPPPRFAAPGPRFDSSPAIPKRALTPVDRFDLSPAVPKRVLTPVDRLELSPGVPKRVLTPIERTGSPGVRERDPVGGMLASPSFLLSPGLGITEEPEEEHA